MDDPTKEIRRYADLFRNLDPKEKEGIEKLMFEKWQPALGELQVYELGCPPHLRQDWESRMRQLEAGVSHGTH